MPNQTPNYSVDQTLTELNPNNLRILRIFPNLTNYLQIFPRTFFFCSLTGLRSLVRIIPNHSRIIPELFMNHKFLTSPNRTRIIHLSLWLRYRYPILVFLTLHICCIYILSMKWRSSSHIILDSMYCILNQVFALSQ